MSFESRIRLLSIWFGFGLAPKAPGTFGTIGAIPLVFVFGLFGDMGYMLATLAFCAFSIWVAQMYEDFVTKEHDASEFVMDEVAGFLVAMTWVPFTWEMVLLAFVLFRILDVLKPWPISYFDKKVPGGVGTVADDLVAGILTNLVMIFALPLLPAPYSL